MVLLLGMALAAGCRGPGAGQEPLRLTSPQKRYARDGQHIQANPVGFLREVLARCAALKQYRLMFYRQERHGLLVQALGPVEEIRAAFRREPFSIKFEWDDPERDYFESVYVAGANDNKLIVRERKGIFPFPPQVRIVNLTDPVKWGRAKNPVTDFGLERVTQRTLLPFDDPQVTKVMTIVYRGLVTLDPMKQSAHHLRIERPPMKGFTYTRQDFYVDADTLLPAGTDLWLPSGELDARYRYAHVDPKVMLGDADFRLTKGHPIPARNQPGDKARRSSAPG